MPSLKTRLAYQAMQTRAAQDKAEIADAKAEVVAAELNVDVSAVEATRNGDQQALPV